jgi:prevent-host-death family protein
MKIASIADVKAHLSAYVNASQKGPVVVTRNGKPVAVLLPVNDEDELERLMMAHSPRLQEILHAARERVQAGRGLPNAEFWKQVKSGKQAGKGSKKRKKSA